MTWRAEIQTLKENGVDVAAGLSEREMQRLEEVVGARLPPDLRAFLSEGLPQGSDFPNWREPDSDAVRQQLDWPFEGMAFDIKNNAFWFESWGVRPGELAEALSIAKSRVCAAPKLVPIYGHRYLPVEPPVAGNPVFSVHQTDVIYYGSDLATYLRCEFGGMHYADAVRGPMRRIRFWSELVEV